MKVYLLFFILFFCSTKIIFAQNDTIKTSIHSKLFDDAKIFWDDGVSYFTYPFKADSKDWLIFSGIAAATYTLMHSDTWVKEHVGRTTTLTLNKDFWDIPTTYGIVTYANITALSTYGIGLISGNDEVRKVGRMLFQSLSYSGLNVMFFRTVIERTRPYYNKGPWDFRMFTTNNEFQSFPSGHTTVAFAFSTILAEYFDTYYSRIFFYGLAASTAFARVYNNQHFLSDVFFGALIGISGGLHTINQEQKRSQKCPYSGLSILPGYNSLNFVYSF
ncbi:MAG TPA: phosphatase PAP2 family protein [Melioribacteraceae bacterium]|nr:phosphatase PAP2 family protein [Melioribacteraceae bacterium]